MILIASPAGTAAKPCTCNTARKVSYTAWLSMGAALITVTLPLTRGSTMKFLPVTSLTVEIRVLISASFRLSVTSAWALPVRNAAKVNRARRSFMGKCTVKETTTRERPKR